MLRYSFPEGSKEIHNVYWQFVLFNIQIEETQDEMGLKTSVEPNSQWILILVQINEERTQIQMAMPNNLKLIQYSQAETKRLSEVSPKLT